MTTALDALAAIGQIPDSELDLADAAIQLARVDAPDADWQAARAHLSELARDADALVPVAGGLPGRALALAGLLTARHRYAGDKRTYDAPANANLIRVTERRRGLPVALGIVWLHCARALGWNAHGVDFPGHFLVALTEGRPGERHGSRQVLVDPFNEGAAMNISELRELAKRVGGAGAALRPGLLRPMSPREVLLRLQNNIRGRRLQARDLPGALQCIHSMLLIAPSAPTLWQESAQLHEALQQPVAAIQAWQRFLDLVPPDGDGADRARAAMGALRTQLN